MTTARQDNSVSAARVLVLSMAFAPCREVGGKRFSYLSQHLSRRCADYHVIARRESDHYKDSTAFSGNVHRTAMIPYWPPRKGGKFKNILARAWAQSFCMVDKYIGWVLPATIAGIRLCREKKCNVVVVTVPQYSAIIAAVAISMATKAKLIVDYRDEWTNYRTKYPKPFGRFLCPIIERFAIRRASAVVLCTDIMHSDFVRAFGSIAPREIEVIYNGFERIDADSPGMLRNHQTSMIYAGTFHGRRRLSVIAPALAQLLREGVISEDSFCFNIYSRLRDRDYALIDELGISGIVQVQERVPYDKILTVMRSSDILFLPSGDEVQYAVPFKFFDYLSVGRPILAVAARQSTVDQLMRSIECGEFAEIGNTSAIAGALKLLLQQEKSYSFNGAERFLWKNAAEQYFQLISRLINGHDA